MQIVRLTASSALLLVWLQAARAPSDYYPPPDSQGGWRSLTAPKDKELRAGAGMDRQKLDAAFDYAQTTSQHGGLLVVRHGWLVYERYYGRGNREANPDMASVGKAFTSISCGIMLKEKHALIPNGLDEKVFTQKYLPEAFPLSDPAKADIKLGHLLAMSSGMHENASPAYRNGEKVTVTPTPLDRSLDIDQSALRTRLWCKPGDGYS
jgi:CubicO group peptidase (beta-lactamase class C family)